MARKAPDFTKWNNVARQFLGDDFFNDMKGIGNQGPLVDIFSGQDEVIVHIELPGMDNIRSINIDVQGDTLYVKGIIPMTYKGYSMITSERKKGEFQKEISLTTMVHPKYKKATYKRGILELRYSKIK